MSSAVPPKALRLYIARKTQTGNKLVPGQTCLSYQPLNTFFAKGCFHFVRRNRQGSAFVGQTFLAGTLAQVLQCSAKYGGDCSARQKVSEKMRSAARSSEHIKQTHQQDLVHLSGTDIGSDRIRAR